MDKLRETAVALVPKEPLVFLKDDSGFTEHIVKQLSYELADRIMGILDREGEVIIKQSDLKVSEYMPTNSVEYRRQIEWSSLVRCGECVFYDPPHIEDGTRRYEYADMPADAFDELGTGLVHSGYGVNVGGRCLRSKTRLARGKSIFMDEDDYCSKGERRADDETD